MTKSWGHALVWASLAGALVGCSTVPDRDPSATRPANAAADAAADGDLLGDEPVPRVESPSRTGNPDNYVVFGRRYRVRDTSEGYLETGVASWYGWDFHGRKTSSGPLFNMFELSAAHKSLPIPTYARVTNLENGRSIVVKINDRGPFVGDRLIDLSYAAAARLDMLDHGTARVEVAALAPYQSLPDLAAKRAEWQERVAIRAAEREEAKEEKAAILHFAHETPIPGRQSKPALAEAQEAARQAKKVRLAARESDRERDGKARQNVKLASAAPLPPKGKDKTPPRAVAAAQDSKKNVKAPAKSNALYLVGTVTERKSAAQQLQNRLTSQLQRSVQVESGSGSRYEVRVPLRNPSEARQVAVRLASLGVSGPRIVAD